MTTPTEKLLRDDEHLPRRGVTLTELCDLIKLLGSRLIESRTLLAEREAQLRKHGAHHSGCALNFPKSLGAPYGTECDCGWSAVEATLPKG